MSETARPKSGIAALVYRVLVEVGSLVGTRQRLWTSTARKLVGGFVFLALVDLNSSHVRDFVRALVASWRVSQTQMKMGAVAAALDAEYASHARYPPPGEFQAYVRQWVVSTGEDPAADDWGTPLLYHVEGAGYELLSCGPDRACQTTDDVRYRGGL